MPDHLHMVVAGLREGSDFLHFVRAAKQSSGFAFARAFHKRLWQLNYFDRSMRKSDDLAAIVAYMLNNPVRAGLVRQPDDYPYWGSQRYTSRSCSHSWELRGVDPEGVEPRIHHAAGRP